MSARVAFASYNGVKVKTPYAITVGHPHSSLLDSTLKIIADFNSTELCGTHLGYPTSENTYARTVKGSYCFLKDKDYMPLGTHRSYNYVNYNYRLYWNRDWSPIGFCGGDNKVVWGDLIINTCHPRYASMTEAGGPVVDRMIMIHELGHVVGLGHRLCEESSVMRTNCSDPASLFFASLTPTDKKNINSLYP